MGPVIFFLSPKGSPPLEYGLPVIFCQSRKGSPRLTMSNEGSLFHFKKKNVTVRDRVHAFMVKGIDRVTGIDRVRAFRVRGIDTVCAYRVTGIHRLRAFRVKGIDRV